MPNTTRWELAPHTAAKHQILSRYLNMWFPVLGNRRGRIVLIDGFAGPGSYLNGEPGSPLIVLRTLLEHKYIDTFGECNIVLVFNEQDAARFEALQQSVAAEEANQGGWPSNVQVVTSNDKFSSMAEDILTSIGDNQLAPTFAFLDPFGYRDIPLDLIRRLLAYQRCELYIYFDYNSVVRFATAGTAADDALTALYGTDEYKNAPASGPTRKRFLIELYERQLHDVVGFEHVQSFEMLNNQNHTGNYMIFCTRSLKGLDGMKAAMWKVDPTGNFRFADRLAGQDVLVGLEPDTNPLQKALLDRFTGQTVSITTVEEFVVSSTPYLRSHVRRKTLVPMQKAGIVTSPNQSRAGFFPEGTLVSFT